MGRGKRRDGKRRPGEPDEPDFIVSYGRHQALGDEVIKESEVTSAPDFVPLFETGHVVITLGAEKLLTRLGIDSASLVNRHMCGDWGDIHPEDREMQLNEQALESGARILSTYVLSGGQKVWIITDQSTTACFRCHPFYAGPDAADPKCSFCHGTGWGKEEHRLTTTVLLPDEY